MTNKKLKNKLLAPWIVIIIGLCFLGTGSYLIYYLVNSSWNTYQLMRRGQDTTGYIISVWEWEDIDETDDGEGNWSYRVTYTYRLPDGRGFTGYDAGKGRLKEELRHLNQGYPVEVTYLPDRPKVSRISANLPGNILGAFFHSPAEFFGGVVCCFFGFAILWVSIRRK